MQYVTLGRAGIKVSKICLGMMSYGSSTWRPWVLDEDAARPFIRRALESGINFFDTADMYSLGRSEEVLGRALHDFASRDQVVVATKVFFPLRDGPNDRGLSRRHIHDAIDASLRRLGMDYVDLYQIHRFDPDTPLEETLEALDAVVRAGKARYVGASSMFAWQLMKALALQEKHGWQRFVSMQNHYNLCYREEEREMLPLCRSEGLGCLPWSPLARGLLSGRSQVRSNVTARADSDEYAQQLYDDALDVPVAERCARVAKERGVPAAQVALAWLLHQPPVVAPIVGATKLPHLDDAIAATELALSEEERRALEEPYRPHRVLGHR
jgi:aryl-alcohol dehydrogenase-like predicted oxidoreductase